jgi:hypothetical protein
MVLAIRSTRFVMDDTGRVSRAFELEIWRNEAKHSRSYLILPGLYAKDLSQLKFRQSILSVFVVALLTAGYSFTALLCFACRNELFQAEGVFLYAHLPLLYVHH